MSKRELDEESGVETTGHEWDGIKELDNPLPKWWLYIMYACIVWSILYWLVMPAWPLWNSYTKGFALIPDNVRLDRARVDSEVKALQAARADEFTKIQSMPIAEVKNNADLFNFAQQAGKSAFGDNCATCHGAGGQGVKGFPSLADDVWLWDGTYEGIRQTINYGIRSGHDNARLSAMPAYGRDGLLDAAQVTQLTDYVMTLSGIEGANAQNAAQGATIFAAQCVACHGATGTGDPLQGAPNLTDKEYLYGGTRADIQNQITNGNGGVMPTWAGRLDEPTITALTIYVHSLGGGK